jgi:phage gpG-like protein
MSGLTIKVRGAREVAAELSGPLTERIRAEVRGEIGALALDLGSRTVAQQLSGQTLKRRTGNLARSVAQSPRVVESGTSVVGLAGTALDYGIAHEFGFTGAVPVKQHLRLVKQAFGRPLKEPKQVTVGAHGRDVKMAAREYLKQTLDALAPTVPDRIGAAVARGTEG